MTDRPILFSAPMVRALLAGTKTQTRRVFVPPKPFAVGDDIEIQIATGEFKPRISAGDRLWVRESWEADICVDDLAPSKLSHGDAIRYVADRSWKSRIPCSGKLRPGMFMPRWASRLTLTVTDVRVQRLQEISEEDALAEGCPYDDGSQFPVEKAPPGAKHIEDGWDCARDWFCDVWESINGENSWFDNPWCAAYTFTVEQRNIDA